MYKVFFALLSIFALCSCTLSNKEIEQHWWKLGDVKRSLFECDSVRLNQHVDVLFFNESKYYSLSGDTIFREDVPYARIVNRNRGFSTRIEVAQFSTRDTLIYFGKN